MTARTADARIVPLIVDRWSPRAFDGTPVPQKDLDVIFEAAALAPSAFNYQPWRFLYAVHGDANWDLFLSLLLPFNAGWARQAGALVIIVSDNLMRVGGEAKPNHSHSFDSGAAWALLALQATALGYHAHGMTGIELDKIRSELAIPDDFRVEAAVAIGRKANPDTLGRKVKRRGCGRAQARRGKAPPQIAIIRLLAHNSSTTLCYTKVNLESFPGIFAKILAQASKGFVVRAADRLHVDAKMLGDLGRVHIAIVKQG